MTLPLFAYIACGFDMVNFVFSEIYLIGENHHYVFYAPRLLLEIVPITILAIVITWSKKKRIIRYVWFIPLICYACASIIEIKDYLSIGILTVCIYLTELIALFFLGLFLKLSSAGKI